MKLVRQAKLAFQGGATDKVYEVDLCEVGPDRFVVNFRHGTRGRELKEGTKTTAPLPRAQAEKVFERLVESKRAEGYFDPAREERPAAAALAAAYVAGPEEAPDPDDPRAKRILARLEAGGRGAAVNRAIWAAGDRRLRAAVPYLEKLAGTDGELRDVAIAYALGLCGGPAQVPLLQRLARRLYDGSATAKRYALEAERLVATGAARDFFVEEALRALPPALVAVARAGDFAAALRAHPPEPELLERVYRVDTPQVRPALLERLGAVPLAPPWFAGVRHVFKAAEQRRDAQVFGILARRFEVTPPGYHDRWGSRSKEARGPNARVAFGEKTRNYLRRRAWRTLRRLGRAGSPDYVRMAAGVLLPFTDADAQPPRPRYDAWAPYWAFNHVLRGEGTSARPSRSGKAFRTAGPVKDAREESFPELWDEQPGALVHLLLESRCAPVHAFAARALRANAAFARELDADVLAGLVASAYVETARLGLELAKARWPGDDLPDDVAVALALSVLDEARAEGFARLEAAGARFAANADAIVRLATHARPDVRAFVRGLLARNAPPSSCARALVERLIAFIRTTDDDARAVDAAQLLGATCAGGLAQVRGSLADELARSARVGEQTLAAEIVHARQLAGEPIPGSFIATFIASPHPSVRDVGVRMLGNLPEEALVASKELLLALATHPLADLRASVRPVARRIAERSPAFAVSLADALVTALLVVAQPEGMHGQLLLVLREDLRSALAQLGKDRVWALVHSRVPQAQELGGVLLSTNVPSEELALKEIVRLASHEIRSIREASWAFLEESAERARQDLATAVAFLDARWEDSRQFAMRFFREAVPREELTPELLVAICDSVRPDVQRFGRELIVERFDDKDGPLYLLRLAEHPSPALQLFASNFLERHAAGHPDRIEALAFYFVTILSAVNRGRVAKDRAFAFLRAEASKSEEVARVVAALLARVSVTVSITDRATAIEAMLEIKKRWPAVEVPLQVKAVPRAV